MKPISIQSAEHYLWGDACDGWHLVMTADMSVIEERMPAETAEQLHLHERARQFFYVLEGELTMELDGAMYTLTRGEGIEVPAGRLHQAMNHDTKDVRFLVMSCPPSHGDRMIADK